MQQIASLKLFYFKYISLKFGLPDCHYLMKFGNTIALLKKYKIEYSSILDIGCANGMYSLQLIYKTKSKAKISGFDISSTSILKAQYISRQVPDSESNFFVADLDSITLKDDYDLVLFLDSLQYSHDFNLVFGKLVEHLKITSHVILYVPVKNNQKLHLPKFINKKQPIYTHNYPDLYTLFSLFQNNSLNILEQKWVGGKAIRYYIAIKNWLSTYSRGLVVVLLPLDFLFAFIDRKHKSFGYGVFFLLKYNK